MSRNLFSYFAGGFGAVLLTTLPVAAVEQSAAQPSTAPVRRVEGVGDTRWSDSLGFVGPGSEPGGAAPQSAVLDVPTTAGAPHEREPKRGQGKTVTRGHLGFAMVDMQPINYGVEDSAIDFKTYGLLTDVGFLFPTSRYTMIPLDLGVLWTLGGATVTRDTNGPQSELEIKTNEIVLIARSGLDVRLVDAPAWDFRLGPRVGVGVAIASASVTPIEDSSDVEAEPRWEVGAQAALTFETFTLEPRWRLVNNPIQAVHYVGVDATWMISKGFGLFARYEARVAASGGFRYRLGTGDGDVDSFGLAHLRSMSNQNTIAMGIAY